MPRNFNIWTLVKAIKTLRVPHGVSTSDISAMLKEDLFVSKSSDGGDVEVLGDRDLITHAYEEVLESKDEPGFAKKASGIFYGTNWRGVKKK